MIEKIVVEVAYALAERQVLLALQVPVGTSARQAVECSGILAAFPEIASDKLKLGLFSKAIVEDRVLLAHDRVEIYRPLIADPKEVRRQRAQAGKVLKK
ncbi:RnfH family protein [Neisseriaceae bacterium TC5R-5]|nr:RnfH family protein [Neisseriaceae bacterium TC5R-5]